MREITYLAAINEALDEALAEDDRVFLMGEDIGLYGGGFGATKGLIEKYGAERIRNTPISESALAGAAVGSAMTGLRPIIEIQFSDFITIAMDQLVNQAAKIHYMYGGKATVPLVMRTAGGSGTGHAAQHSQSLENWTAHIPGLKVVQPSTAYDAKGLLHAAIEDNNPVMFYEHKLSYKTKGTVPAGKYVIPLGVADIKRLGTHVTVVATGIMVEKSLAAAEQLAAEGISLEVIDPRTLVPLDTKTIIQSVQKTGRLLIVHEAVKRSGFGGEVASLVAESEAFYALRKPIQRLGGKAIPMPYQKELEYHAIPQLEDILAAVRHLMDR
ncbi:MULTISPECIES: alpha-ketoacid dehydrogenase subunit beta [Carnobacterium]|uniref:Alpha-ketoacid dehydrogenase subunit beta n=1 Tax=Carnobacterium antarcticum TaxID=2126436 RepID=A0ABW4NPJ4_9LACT|nr:MULTISPECIES: alpha-ketoacid dehydrogenase subunit beta [unclassified Carnobacterium]ALV22585.1 Acetoin dehydrogenase E1 component beta-subunit [Carnobacterium sp. CP1]QQP70496.1 alpha-ketoacid dehydrogenase subunit beta [Carnobacterium sp. CS13]